MAIDNVVFEIPIELQVITEYFGRIAGVGYSTAVIGVIRGVVLPATEYILNI